MSQRYISRLVHILILVALLVSPSLALANNPSPETPPQLEKLNKYLPIIYTADPNPNPFFVPPPTSFRQDAPATATFTINYLEGVTNIGGDYCNTWPAAAKTAFTYAANVWGTLINSSIPIEIDACWTDLPTGVLGYSGSDAYYRNFTGAPQANTWFAVSLANALSGSDLNGADPDMHIAYSRTFNWHYDPSTTPPGDKYDFATVVLHEIGHGLNFAGSMTVSGGLGYWGWAQYPDPSIYDRFTENGSGTPLLSYTNGSTALRDQLISGNIYFDGPNANAANSASRVKLYAPGTWSSGSSYAHLDEIFNGTPHALMTYSLGTGEAIHAPGTVALGLLKDLGWTLVTANTAPTISGLPDQVLQANTSLNNAIDLWAYASDNEFADNLLTFSINNTPAAGAGVSIDSNRYIDINPSAGWTGQTDVTIKVTDPGSLFNTDTFQVTVASQKIWNGSVSTDWHTAANWTPSGVPTSSDDVRIPLASRQPVVSGADALADDLTIFTGASLDLTTRKVSVEGVLVNYGTLKQTKTSLPSGNTAFLYLTNAAGTQARYYGVELTLPVVESAAAVDVTVSVGGNQYCPGLSNGVRRCFTITPTAPSSATVRYYFTENERLGHVLNNLEVHEGSANWASVGSPYTRAGSGDAQYVTTSSFQPSGLYALRPAGGGGGKIYLALVLKYLSPPQAPVLSAISNPDLDGSYAVNWSAPSTAIWYVVEEDDNPSFTSPAQVYDGPTTTWNASGKTDGTYYYRVRATNDAGSSGWSNSQSVLVQAPTGPNSGFWDGYGMEFYVTTDHAYVDDFAIYINVGGCGTYKITHTPQEPISSNYFSFAGSFYASGTFSGQTSASGSTGLSNFYISGCGYVNGGPYSWSATWQYAALNPDQFFTATLVQPSLEGVPDPNVLVEAIK